MSATFIKLPSALHNLVRRFASSRGIKHEVIYRAAWIGFSDLSPAKQGELIIRAMSPATRASKSAEPRHAVA